MKEFCLFICIQRVLILSRTSMPYPQFKVEEELIPPFTWAFIMFTLEFEAPLDDNINLL